MFIMKRNAKNNKKSVYHLPSITIVDKSLHKYSHKICKSQQNLPSICISFDQQQKSQKNIPNLIQQYYKNLKSSRADHFQNIYSCSEKTTNSYLKIKRKKKSTKTIPIANKKQFKKQNKNKIGKQFIRYQDLHSDDIQNNETTYQLKSNQKYKTQTKHNLIYRLKKLECYEQQNPNIPRRCISRFFTQRDSGIQDQPISPSQKSQNENNQFSRSPNNLKDCSIKVKLKLHPLKKYSSPKLNFSTPQQNKNAKMFTSQHNVDHLSAWNHKQQQNQLKQFTHQYLINKNNSINYTKNQIQIQ